MTDHLEPPGPAAARTWAAAAHDAAPALAALALCPLGAALARGSRPAAIAHARALSALERQLHVAVEAHLAAGVQAHGWLSTLLSSCYLWIHLPALGGALVWVWLERRHAFGIVRTTFVIAQVLTIAANLAYPAAPPWMLTGDGGHDVARSIAYLLQNPYAAIPSGHVVFALIAGGTVAWLARPPLARLAGILYPLLVVVLVAATGNHLWIDAAGGMLVTAASFGAAAVRHRAGPDRARPTRGPQRRRRRAMSGHAG
jgi:hypothetical protein